MRDDSHFPHNIVPKFPLRGLVSPEFPPWSKIMSPIDQYKQKWSRLICGKASLYGTHGGLTLYWFVADWFCRLQVPDLFTVWVDMPNIPTILLGRQVFKQCRSIDCLTNLEYHFPNIRFIVNRHYVNFYSALQRRTVTISRMAM